ncbi:MAG: hypothetical protein HHJ15_05755 [Rhodoferax sp.]|nr:hypothetical protein [Rhodoferax sp.]
MTLEVSNAVFEWSEVDDLNGFSRSARRDGPKYTGADGCERQKQKCQPHGLAFCKVKTLVARGGIEPPTQGFSMEKIGFCAAQLSATTNKIKHLTALMRSQTQLSAPDLQRE